MNEQTAGLRCIELIAALHGVQERLEAALEPLGLSLAKLGVLAQLVEASEPVPLGTLADRLSCVRSNVTQLVDRLEADKLVARADDARDRRSVRAELTTEGRSRHVAGMQALKEAEQKLFSPLSQQQRDALLDLLRVLQAGS